MYFTQSVDTRLHPMLDIRFDESFFQRGDFPKTVFNGSQEIPLTNPWVGYDNSAPFNQRKPSSLFLTFLPNTNPFSSSSSQHSS